MLWYYYFPTQWIWPNLGASEIDVLELGDRAAGYLSDEDGGDGLPWGALMDVRYYMDEGGLTYTEACVAIRDQHPIEDFSE